MLKKQRLLSFKLSGIFIMLINIKKPTKFLGILTFISMINFMLSWVEHEKSFITSEPGVRCAPGPYGLVFNSPETNLRFRHLTSYNKGIKFSHLQDFSTYHIYALNYSVNKHILLYYPIVYIQSNCLYFAVMSHWTIAQSIFWLLTGTIPWPGLPLRC